jgi:acetyl-CoA acetyltransferase
MTQQTPVLVGISHLEQRFTDFESAKEPVQLMIDAVNQAAEDAGSKELLNAGSVRVIRGIWPYEDPARAVAQAIGSPNAETALTAFGGNFVQTALNQSALDIQAGLHDVIILTGAECGNTQAKAAKAGPGSWLGGASGHPRSLDRRRKRHAPRCRDCHPPWSSDSNLSHHGNRPAPRIWS